MANTFASLHYHVIFSTKNRELLIHQDIEQRVWSYLGGIVRENDMKAIDTKSTATRNIRGSLRGTRSQK